MLHEASSIEKAIKKAWSDAGKPAEFTIKILEAGQTNFLGLSKRPAIISITYEPKKQPLKNQSSNVNKPGQKPNTVLGVKNPAGNRQQQIRPKDQQIRPQQIPQQNKVQRPQQNQQLQQRNTQPYQQLSAEQPQEIVVWQQEWVSVIKSNLDEILNLLEVKVEYSTAINKKILTVSFDNHVLEDTLEEKQLFMSLSYLLIQLLKRSYKKKFRGFQLTITTKNSQTRAHDQSHTAGSY